MISLIRIIINYLFTCFFRKKVLCGSNLHCNRTSRVVLSYGSNRNDIHIANNCRIYGELISQSNGKIKIDDFVQISSNTRIMSVNMIEIGRGTVIAPNTVICDNNNHPIGLNDRIEMQHSDWKSPLRRWANSVSNPIKIGEYVWIGTGVRICKGVTIGDGCIIAANSVVTKDVPNYSIAAGNPANIVKKGLDKL